VLDALFVFVRLSLFTHHHHWQRRSHNMRARNPSDVPLKTFLVHLNSKQQVPFILFDIDDTHLFMEAVCAASIPSV
jgi:hypothetical protein